MQFHKYLILSLFLLTMVGSEIMRDTRWCNVSTSSELIITADLADNGPAEEEEEQSPLEEREETREMFSEHILIPDFEVIEEKKATMFAACRFHYSIPDLSITSPPPENLFS
ncbi:MAG: hypothetical protein IPM74_01300 [Crocinitomicaceae bacterium]|nr:hypothetical protein [Crocinitomicaceae bacterium]